MRIVTRTTYNYTQYCTFEVYLKINGVEVLSACPTDKDVVNKQI